MPYGKFLKPTTTGKICTLVRWQIGHRFQKTLFFAKKKKKKKKPDFVKESFRIFRNILLFTWNLQKKIIIQHWNVWTCHGTRAQRCPGNELPSAMIYALTTVTNTWWPFLKNVKPKWYILQWGTMIQWVPKGICSGFILHLKESILAYSQFGVAPMGIPENILIFFSLEATRSFLGW